LHAPSGCFPLVGPVEELLLLPGVDGEGELVDEEELDELELVDGGPLEIVGDGELVSISGKTQSVRGWQVAPVSKHMPVTMSYIE